MRAGIDIWIDAQCNAGGFPQPVGDRAKLVQFGKALDIKLPDAGLKPGCHFVIGFTNA